MGKTHLRKRLIEWLVSHGLWEIFRYALAATFVWLISVGGARLMHAAINTAFNMFLVLGGVIGLAWTFGFLSFGRMRPAISAVPLLKELRQITEEFMDLMYKFPNSEAVAAPFSKTWRPLVGTLDIPTHQQEVMRWHSRVLHFLDSLADAQKNRSGLTNLAILRAVPFGVLSKDECLRCLYEVEGFLPETILRTRI